MKLGASYALNFLFRAGVTFLVMQAPQPGLAQLGILDPRTFCIPLEVHEGNPDEKPCLNELKEVAKRDSSVLTLKLGNGKTKVISDSKECNDPDQEASCVSYRLVGYIGDRQFMVQVQPYECPSVLLVNRRTGAETMLGGWPNLSPSKKRFVVTSSSVAGECSPAYAIAVFSLANDSPRLEWQSGPPDFEDYDYDGWDGDDRVGLRVDDNGKHKNAYLKLTAQGWQLTRDMPTAPTQFGPTSATQPSTPRFSR
jgi:hypothetical protein